MLLGTKLQRNERTLFIWLCRHKAVSDRSGIRRVSAGNADGSSIMIACAKRSPKGTCQRRVREHASADGESKAATEPHEYKDTHTHTHMQGCIHAHRHGGGPDTHTLALTEDAMVNQASRPQAREHPNTAGRAKAARNILRRNPPAIGDPSFLLTPGQGTHAIQRPNGCPRSLVCQRREQAAEGRKQL